MILTLLKKFFFPNYKILIVFVIVFVMGIFAFRSNEASQLLDFVRKSIGAQSKEIADQMASEKDIYKQTAEELNQKYKDIEKEKQNLEKVNTALEIKLQNTNAKLSALKQTKIKEAPKEIKDLAQAFKDMGYDNIVLTCP